MLIKEEKKGILAPLFRKHIANVLRGLKSEMTDLGFTHVSSETMTYHERGTLNKTFIFAKSSLEIEVNIELWVSAMDIHSRCHYTICHPSGSMVVAKRNLINILDLLQPLQISDYSVGKEYL